MHLQVFLLVGIHRYVFLCFCIVRLLPGTDKTFKLVMVAQHCPEWNEAHVPAIPEPVVYVVPLYHILCKLTLIPAGDHGEARKAARTRVIRGAYATVRARQRRQDRAVPCCTLNVGHDLAHGLPRPCHLKSNWG